MNGVILLKNQRYILMTAILTKQNARDKAFVGGNSTPTTNGEFETIHVKGIATIEGKIENEQIDGFEKRIKAIEDTPADGLPFEDGLNDFIINASTLKTLETDDYNILEITFEDSTDYNGDVFELIFPTSMNLSKGIISMSNHKFNNPRITFNETYLMDYIDEDDKPRLYMSKSIIDKPMDLFTSGFIRINYIAKTKQNVNSKENQLINFKCNQIEADNCFKLYRSPLPDFYEMKSYGITNDKSFYSADYGYLPGSPEFEALIDGQTFEFHDEAFGTDYKMTKQGNEWVGNNVSYHIPISATIKGETKFCKHQTQAIYIKQNETNRSILRSWISYYSDENPFKIINEKGLLKFVDCEIDKYDDNVDGYWAVYLKCTQKKSCDFTCSLMINGLEYQTEFGFEYASYEAESCYKVNSNNCYEYLPFHYNGKNQEGNPPYGLKLYMPTDNELIFKIADVKYEEGTNTFEFLASTGYYTVSPRPEACTTLFTNYNIQTSGVVIGENIESHVFVLNSLGNTVDIAVNHISELQNYCIQLQKELDEVKNKTDWFDYVKDVLCITGSVVNFMGGPTKLLSIAEKGISNLIGVSFAADEELIDDAVIVACDRASMVLAEKKEEILEKIDEEPLLEEKLNRYRYLCTNLKYDYHIEISFAIDDKEEVVNVRNYGVNEDLTINDLSTGEIPTDCRIIFENPYLIIDSEYKPLIVKTERISKGEHLELGLGADLKDNHILSSAATVKLIENHKNNMLSSINIQMDNFAKATRELEYTAKKFRSGGSEEMEAISCPNYNFTLKKPSPNFKIRIGFRWINDEGEDDWYAITADVINNVVSNKKLVNGTTSTTKRFTFQELGMKVTARMITYLKYTDGVIYMPGSNLQKTYDLINYDPNETYFIESVVYGSDLNDYALKTDIKELPTDLINETTLENTLNNYATKTQLTTIDNKFGNYTTTSDLSKNYALKASIPTDYVNSSTLTTKLNDYALKTDINNIDLTDYRKLNDLNVSSTKHISFERVNDTLYETGPFRNNVYMKGTFTKSESEEIRFDFLFQKQNNSGENLWYGKPFPTGTMALVQVMWTHDIATDKYELKVHYSIDRPFTLEDIYYDDVDEIALKTDIPTDYVNSSSLTNTLNDYALKTDIPTDYVNSSSLTNTLNDYSTTSECNENYVKTTGTNNIIGTLTITTAKNSQFNHIACILAPEMTNSQVATLQIGKERNTEKALILTYREPGIGTLSLYNKNDSIIFTSSSVNLCMPTTINGNLTVNGLFNW